MSAQRVHMVLHDLLIELLRLVNLLHELFDARLVVDVLLALSLFELSFLVAQLHQDALVLGPLLLELAVEAVIFALDVADFLVGQVDSAEHIGLRCF